MESLQIIDKFCSSHLMIFLNMAYIESLRSYKKPKDIQSSLHFLSPRLSYAVCLLNFRSTRIQYSVSFLAAFLLHCAAIQCTY